MFRKNVIDEVMIKLSQDDKEVNELTWTLLQMGVVVHIALDLHGLMHFQTEPLNVLVVTPV